MLHVTGSGSDLNESVQGLRALSWIHTAIGYMYTSCSRVSRADLKPAQATTPPAPCAEIVALCNVASACLHANKDAVIKLQEIQARNKML